MSEPVSVPRRDCLRGEVNVNVSEATLRRKVRTSCNPSRACY